MSPHRDSGAAAAPELVVPPGLTVDEVTADRLARQLAAAPAATVGIVAPLGAVPPGSSTRVHAEWRSLEPLDALQPIGTGPIAGAVLARAGTGVKVEGDTIAVDAGELAVDRGAVVHAESTTGAERPGEADAEAVSPFRWRPVVLFLAVDPTEPVDPAVDRLADGLFAAGAEPRLAAAAVDARPRRHAPCEPTAASVARVRPDIIVALDPAALDQAPAWCTRRETVLIALDRDLGDAIELVSWQIDRAPTRLRARCGPDVEVDDLLALVNRLASGPQPAPPRPVEPLPEVETPVALSADRVVLARSVSVLGVDPARPLLAGLADRLSAAGHDVADDGSGSRSVDVLLVAAGALVDALDMVAARTTAGLATVVVVEQDAEARRLGDQVEAGTVDPARVVAVVASRDAAADLRGRGLRVQHQDRLTTRAERDALRAAAGRPLAAEAPVIGWSLGRFTDAAVASSIVGALASLLEARPDAQVEIVPADDVVVGAMPLLPQATVRSSVPDPGELAHWDVQVTAAGADRDVVVRAAYAGVPTVLDRASARSIGGLADPTLVVDEARQDASWCSALDRALDEAAHAELVARAMSVADAVDGDDAGAAAAARLLGWLDRLGAA